VTARRYDAPVADTAPAASSRRWLLASHARSVLAGAYVAALGAVLVAYVISRVTGRPFEDLTKDPVSVLGHAPVYIGFLSHVAVMLWAGAAAVCLFAAVALRRLAAGGAQALLAAGLISALLAVDDAFLLHERVGPRLGVPQPAIMAGYVLLLILFVLRYRQHLRRGSVGLLAAAAVFLALSLALDFFGDLDDFARSAQFEPFEDTAKLLGLVSWIAYFSHLALVSLIDAARPPEPDPDVRAAEAAAR
jgi:hypothetical protein